jgi:ATP adenylyltransferase/5',5'''-P-1,P-4-tetraphosphate phosphorylase II
MLKAKEQFQFRISPSLKNKPYRPEANATKDTQANPFQDDDPEFNLGPMGDFHTIVLNKYCVVRPQFVIYTNDFQKQSDFLNDRDLDAAWKALCAFKTRHIIIYNCGVQAGCSIGYKHLQLIPVPEVEAHEMFPDLYKPDLCK